MRFIWDFDKAQANQEKHAVPFEEAAEVFADPDLLDEFDVEHSDIEPRYRAIGLSRRRLLVVVYTEPDTETIRIVSARKANRILQRKYDQK